MIVCINRMSKNDILVDILKTSSHKREKENSVFRNIRGECEEKIRKRLREGGKTILFDFPIVKPGLPTYDIEKCVAYMAKHMHARGLDTEMTAPRTMRISWERALKEAKRLKVAEVLCTQKRRREERRRRRRQKEESRAKKEAATAGPRLPPNADDPNDLFSIKSIQNLQSLAKDLRGI